MKSFLKYILFFTLGAYLFSCQSTETRFSSIDSEDSGLIFVNELSPTSNLNILTYLYYYNGGGVAIADFNGDGLNDIYFTCNQCADKLYLNKGDFKFEDISEESGIKNDFGWKTGVTHMDINNDGLLDIYVCKVGEYKSISGTNLLYLNQGNNENGIPFFVESSKSYGLNTKAFSSQAAFFDYDLDGDLDMYLLCHSVYPNRSYGVGVNRMKIDSLAGDKLYENVNGYYSDVTSGSGIFQGKIGYGLGLAISDVNQDGYPDIYIGNDFFENDYLYLNNGDKSFSEVISANPNVLGHTTHYSMGNCASDINNDGLIDLFSLDMLPEDLQTLKSSGVEDPYPTYNRYLNNGYAPQYMQNTLHVNRGNGNFSEVGFQSGVAATEWSWGILSADLDMDGLKDVYITNGIVGATNDMDYIKFIAQGDVQREIDEAATDIVLDFTKQIPEKKVSNYAFKNAGDAIFENKTKDWFDNIPSFSNGSAYGDLDNDGDLDLVVNNVNQKAFLYRNTTNDLKKANFIQIRLKGSGSNTYGIGAKMEIYAGDLFIYEENFPVKSYLSTVPNSLTLGLGDKKNIDSLRVTWPDQSKEVLYNVELNTSIVIDYANADRAIKSGRTVSTQYLSDNTPVQMDFVHTENPTVDFDRDPLVPFALSNEGPGVAIGDINGDGLDDLFIAGAKFQSSELFIQGSGGTFTSQQKDLFALHAKNEDIQSKLFDIDGDGDLDLVVVSGGNEFTTGDPLKPRLYKNNDGSFELHENTFTDVFINASALTVFDMENDGDLDLVIASDAVPTKFGETPLTYVFENNGKGDFENVSSTFGNTLQNAGNINEIQVVDMDGNGFDDLIVAGDWMPIQIYMNNGKELMKSTIPNSEGWWRALAVYDYDKDGDLDIVAGNWGLNTRLSTSEDAPIRLYRSDFDGNGNTETVITYVYKGKETLLSSKDELVKQMPFINKKYLSYKAFAEASIADIFPSVKLTSAMKKEVKILSTCLFKNKGNNEFECLKLPFSAQSSSVNDIMVDDFNLDGFDDLLLVGNNYELSTQLGRLDASHGVLLLNDQKGFFYEPKGQLFNIEGPARTIEKLTIEGVVHYVVTMNNDKPIFFKRVN